MKRIKSLLALLLALTMILTLLSACGKKEPEPSSDPGKTVTTPAQQDNEPNNTDTMTTTSSSQQNEEPAASSDTETPSDAQPEPEPKPEKPTYGGVLTSMVMSFMYNTLMSEQTVKDLAFGEDMINRIESEYNGFAHDYAEMPDETAQWLDEIFLEAIGIDYSGVAKDELDEIRNMVLVIRAQNSFYFGLPESDSLLKQFLGETGMEVYQRWNTKLENRSDRLLDQIMNENEAIMAMKQANAAYLEAEFGPTQSPDFEITDLTVDTRSFETNGDTYITVTISCPELAGSNKKPTISLIFFDDNGKEINRRDTIGKPAADAGVYTCNFTFNTVNLETDVPLEGHVYAYRTIPGGSQYSTIDECKFVY